MAEKRIKRLKKEQHQERKAINHEQEELIEWFQNVKFRKKLIGGVDETYLWKKLEELNRLYDASIRAERVRYDALIREHTKACNAVIRKHRRKIQGNSESDMERK